MEPATSANKYLRLKPILQRMLLLVITSLMLWSLHKVGWNQVLSRLPSNPLFYALSLVLYSSLPVTESFVYARLWKTPFLRLLPIFVQKKVWNEEVFGYSGELALYAKSRSITGKANQKTAADIRDVSILSAMASNTVAIGILVYLVWSGILPAERLVDRFHGFNFSVAIIIVAVAAILVWKFRTHVYSQNFQTSIWVYLFYLTRFSAHHALMVVQWMVVLPHVPFHLWLIYIALVIVINRIPFLPGKDLIFVWLGVELAPALEAASAEVAGMLLVSGVLGRLYNLGGWVLTSRIQGSQAGA
jgi:hypothetical protein